MKNLPLHKWIKEVPDFPCVFLTRKLEENGYEYVVYVFDWVDEVEGSSLGWFDGLRDDELGDLGEFSLHNGEIFIAEVL